MPALYGTIATINRIIGIENKAIILFLRDRDAPICDGGSRMEVEGEDKSAPCVDDLFRVLVNL